MAKSRQSNETAKALVSPLFAWTQAMLKGGEMMLDSMEAAARKMELNAIKYPVPKEKK